MIVNPLPPKSPEPAVGAVSSGVAVHAASRRWLFFRWPMRSLIITIAFAVSCTATLASDTNNVPEWSNPFSVHGKKYDMDFFPRCLNGTADWKMGASEPPISVNQAYRLARHALDALLPNLHDVTLAQITFERKFGTDGKQHACYDIRFYSPDLDVEHFGGVVSIHNVTFEVLMDGTVITPKPASDK